MGSDPRWNQDNRSNPWNYSQMNNNTLPAPEYYAPKLIVVPTGNQVQMSPQNNPSTNGVVNPLWNPNDNMNQNTWPANNFQNGQANYGRPYEAYGNPTYPLGYNPSLDPRVYPQENRQPPFEDAKLKVHTVTFGNPGYPTGQQWVNQGTRSTFTPGLQTVSARCQMCGRTDYHHH